MIYMYRRQHHKEGDSMEIYLTEEQRKALLILLERVTLQPKEIPKYVELVKIIQDSEEIE